MAKVRNNIFVRGLSGALGGQVVIRTTRSGKTIIANKPMFDKNRAFTTPQLAQQSAFKQATAYAKASKTQPVYVQKAKAMNSISYNMAVADWFHKPEVLEIDAGGWTGEMGGTLRIRAIDDVMVRRVSVVIRDPNQAVLEEGEAVQSSLDGTWWVYTTRTDIPTMPSPTLTATAEDLPGNKNSLALPL